MARKKKDTRTISIIVNLIIVIWMAYCVYDMLLHGLAGNMSGSNWTVFRYYTIDSNVFAAIASLVMLISRIIKGQPGSFATQFKYYGTCTVVVTLMTVLAFLGPKFGYAKMLEGDNLYMHLVGPLLALISFCFLDRGPKLSTAYVFKALIPTLIYALVYMVMVLFEEKWPDFYGFTAGGMWYISFIAMMAAAFVIALIVKALHNDK